jgi:hypothetical protein
MSAPTLTVGQARVLDRARRLRDAYNAGERATSPARSDFDGAELADAVAAGLVFVLYSGVVDDPFVIVSADGRAALAARGVRA